MRSGGTGTGGSPSGSLRRTTRHAAGAARERSSAAGQRSPSGCPRPCRSPPSGLWPQPAGTLSLVSRESSWPGSANSQSFSLGASRPRISRTKPAARMAMISSRRCAVVIPAAFDEIPVEGMQAPSPGAARAVHPPTSARVSKLSCAWCRYEWSTHRVPRPLQNGVPTGGRRFESCPRYKDLEIATAQVVAIIMVTAFSISATWGS